MRIATAAKFLAGAAFLVHSVYAMHASAYDPNSDPDALRRKTDRSPMRRDLVFPLVGEYERLQPGAWRREGPGPGAPQPYTYAGPPPAPPQRSSIPTGPVDPFLYYGYPYGHPLWIPVETHSSPRIPWWSLHLHTKP